ncbi:ATP-binding cassette domain-containing protein [bacterium]|nr:ATP-binding cassette domain-containing protein [bacterium]
MSEWLFYIKDLDLGYNERRLFSSFCMQVEEGEKIVIEGRSGIGKSSLLRLLMGTALPDSGDIFFRGQLLDRHSVQDVRSSVGWVGQEADLGDSTVRGLIRQVLSYKVNRHILWDDELISREINWLELPDTILDEMFPRLSGGEKQRVGILIALLLNRQIFFMDEITAALDPALKQKVIDRFLSHPTWTVLAISHDPGWQVSGLARIITLEAV